MPQKLATFLNPSLQQFLILLHQKFEGRRRDVLSLRKQRSKNWIQGQTPDFLKQTQEIRETNWRVVDAPQDLQKRHVEITGPAEPKMIINALNSGANVFMADFEDSLSPRLDLLLEGQTALSEAVRETLTLDTNGKSYRLQSPKKTTLVVRPRGWHLTENHFLIDQQPMAGALFDFGIYFFNNASELLSRGSGPYFYLPKMESHLEARLWADVFRFSENYLQIPFSSIRVTILIETLPAAFEMDEILFELKDYASGLNAGRWDYIFSFIKKMHPHEFALLPDRSQVTMNTPFMRAYCELLVKTCHRRQAHAMGGMSAFIPNRHEPDVTSRALEQVKADKAREALLGFDGTWVAHPDLIPIARGEFEKILGSENHQKHQLPSSEISAFELLHPRINSSTITEAGICNNINVSLLYLDRWLSGVGAAALYNLMEDAATAEISRSQLWQWLQKKVVLAEGSLFTTELYLNYKARELEKIQTQFQTRYLEQASRLLDELVLSPEFTEFLTLKAYDFLVLPNEILNVSSLNSLKGVNVYEPTTA